ncbi:MAG: lysozyme inhibitor LprI family protein [Cyanobacteriota bacterium]
MTKGVGYGRRELQHGFETLDLTMRRGIVLSLLGALFPLLPSPSSAAPVCPDSLSTADQTRCLMKELEASDRQLQQALMGVAKEAKQVPGPTFQTLWRDNLKGFYKTSADPMQQAEAFRANRRAVCAYAKSVGFQGTGYGITTTRCELALTRTLLDELKP